MKSWRRVERNGEYVACYKLKFVKKKNENNAKLDVSEASCSLANQKSIQALRAWKLSTFVLLCNINLT